MAYERGGKVWVDEKNLGWVFLEEDWKDDRLPEDLVEEAGLLGVEFRLANSLERAELGGYAKDEDGWFFYLSPDTLEYHGLGNEAVYLLCELNNWRANDDWLLSRRKTVYSFDSQVIPVFWAVVLNSGFSTAGVDDGSNLIPNFPQLW